MPDAIEVRKIPLKNVSDASGLAELIDTGVLEADRVIAVIGKTEGNGGVNDYTRILADRAFREVLMEKGSRDRDAVMQVPIVWSGGTDGVLSPHATVFATLPPDHPDAQAGRAQPRPTPAPPGRGGGAGGAAPDRGVRHERTAAARGHRAAAHDREGGGRREAGDGAGG